jgi:hypothetical protein
MRLDFDWWPFGALLTFLNRNANLFCGLIDSVGKRCAAGLNVKPSNSESAFQFRLVIPARIVLATHSLH